MRKLKNVVAFLRRKLVFAKPLEQKTYVGWLAKKYNPSPVISFIIQSHNKSGNVLSLVKKLRTIANVELIVIDDGSTLEHTIRLTRFLTNANEFLLRCNDLYEILTYGRALHFARGKYVILLQDDDDFETDKWVHEGLNHFDHDSLLVILGGRDGARLLPVWYDDSGKRGPFVREGNVAFRANSFTIELYKNTESVPGFTYVQYVDRAPMWIRRELFMRVLHDFDTQFAPFQWDDAEICLRAWTLGLHVGHYPAQFKTGGLGTGGMQLWNHDIHQRQDEVNVKRVYDLYAHQLDHINSLVDQRNTLMTNA